MDTKATPPTDLANAYAATYQQDYGFEQHMVAARQQHVAKALLELKPSIVLEVGCGQSLLIDALAKDFPQMRFKEWHIVEPANAFASVAEEATLRHSCLKVHHNRLETYTGTTIKADVAILSSLLHEVNEPDQLIEAAIGQLSPQGYLVINVPNAMSLHRQLAVAMGLISVPDTLTARNKELKQQTVFTKADLAGLMASHGLEISCEGGFMLKPFTHAQMEACLPLLPKNVLQGLYQLGEQYPELASEISCIARRL